MQTIYDPLRKKEVALTPEERVRQWCIGVLSQQLEVPVHMMMSETGLKLGDKKFRADILIYDRQARPLAIVECKRPEVGLSQEVMDQIIRYNMVLNLPFLFITNGIRTVIFRRIEREGMIRYEFMDKAPTYTEMLSTSV